MAAGDPLPFDPARLDPGDLCRRGGAEGRDETPLIEAAWPERGCRYQFGTDMLFEQIPDTPISRIFRKADGTTTPDELREVAAHFVLVSVIVDR